MKIYVAGKFSQRNKVRSIMDGLEARGYIITCDWTTHIAPERLQKGEGCFVTGHKTYAQEDLEGVKCCDVLVGYMPNSEIFYKGAWIEVGIALGLDKEVILIGNEITSVFLGLPNIWVVQYPEDIYDLLESFKVKINSSCDMSSDHVIV